MDNEVLSWAAPFVVMPDHVHLLLTPGEITVSERSDSSRAASHIGLRRNSGVATGFINHRVRDREDLEVRGEYIHQNPLRARLVECAECYAYSSVYRPPLKEPSSGG